MGAQLGARLRAFGAFWYDFVIGDDWVIAAGIVLALLGTWLLGGCGRWRRTLRGLSGRCDRLRLRDSGRLLFRLGLGEEVLVAEDGSDHDENHGHGGAHIATTAAGALRLQIGIVNFRQRKLPIVYKGQSARQLLYLW